MKANKISEICGIVCLCCGLITLIVVFSQHGSSTYYKILGPIQLLTGTLIITAASQRRKKER